MLILLLTTVGWDGFLFFSFLCFFSWVEGVFAPL